MRKYIVAFLLFILCLIAIENAYALDGDNWVIGVPHPVIARLWSCSSSTNCTSEQTLNKAEVTTDVGGTDYIYYPGSFYYSNSFSMPANGIAWTYNTGTGFTKGYLYAQTTYVCLNDTSTYFVLDDYGLDTGTSYSHTNVRAIYNTSNILSGQNFVFDTQPRCQYFTTIFEATQNTKTYSIKLDTTTTVNTRYHLMGYETTLLGQADLVTNESLTNAISGSGLATAQSVEDLADAQEQMRDDIVQNQNENTDKEIESQKVCNEKVLKYSDKVTDGYLNSSGSIISANNWGVTDYLEINRLEILNVFASEYTFSCFYNSSKQLISCIPVNTSVGVYSLPTGTKYARFSIRNNDVPEYKVSVCKSGNQAIADGQQDINNTLNNSDTSGANSDAGGFFSGFSNNDFGLSSIITMPLQFINGLASSTCYDLSLPMPFINQNVTLPCMSSIYQTHFSSFFTLYQTITTGFIAYWVCVNIFRLVWGFKNPDSGQIEVMDL